MWTCDFKRDCAEYYDSRIDEVSKKEHGLLRILKLASLKGEKKYMETHECTVPCGKYHYFDVDRFRAFTETETFQHIRKMK